MCHDGSRELNGSEEFLFIAGRPHTMDGSAHRCNKGTGMRSRGAMKSRGYERMDGMTGSMVEDNVILEQGGVERDIRRSWQRVFGVEELVERTSGLENVERRVRRLGRDERRGRRRGCG